ncbi:MAG: phosphoribosyl-ATP pyrophosphatase [Magnetococcales bacterium]|nr:phosphoribosyl-ATP pyrophosphatase [Magnetococcales bacterium]HIJ83182.1 phosphoribosyl-ATP diphosphatase [Magnetococcales bacterium]
MTPSPSACPFFSRLHHLLGARKEADPASSYVARLHRQGLDKILEKVGEESIETILAAKNGDDRQVVHEMADLWFHTLVLLAHCDIHPDKIMDELIQRHAIANKNGDCVSPTP